MNIWFTFRGSYQEFGRIAVLRLVKCVLARFYRDASCMSVVCSATQNLALNPKP